MAGTSTELMPPCAAIMALNPSRIALEPLLALLGDRTVGTMNEVAAEFGMSPNTVKQSWRSAGMPGEQGCYRLAEIVKWRLEHEAKLSGISNRFADLADKELARKEKEAEVRKLELQAERLERKEAMAKGELVAIADVNRGWTIAYANLAE